MIRRSFRLGLTLGLLGGLAIALVKMLGGRNDASPAPATVPTPWPRLDTSTPPATSPAWTPSEAGAPPTAAVPAPPVAQMPSTAAPGPAPAKKAKKAPLKAAPRTSTATKGAKAAKAASTAKKAKKAAAPAWVVPDGDVCPTGHPVKARLASGIFHVPGMLNYLRTRPDRCYRDAAAAEADGLRAAKR